MSISKRLKELIVAFGGAESAAAVPGTRIDSLLARLTEAVRQGGSGLPAVTTDDNGDLLTVVGGVWAKAAPPTELPAVSSSDNGKVLKVYGGVWAARDDGIEPYNVIGSIDTDTGAMTLQNINAATFASVAQTRPIHFSVELGEQTIEMWAFVTVQIAGTNYDFAIIGPNGSAYVSGHLGGSDAVVVTPATT